MRTQARLAGCIGAWLLAAVGFFLPVPEAGAIKRERSVEAKERAEAVLITARNTKKKTVGFCSGALIAPNVVLTAGHCTEGFDTWEVLAPYAKDTPGRSQSKVAKVHPRYKLRDADNDLALLILEDDIDTGQKPPQLYAGEMLPLGSKLQVVGRVENGKLAGARLFKSTDVAIVADAHNIHVYGGNPPVVEKGDSGGPVYGGARGREIVAVVSGYLDQSGEPVPTDLYCPLTRGNKDWFATVLRQAQRERTKRE